MIIFAKITNITPDNKSLYLLYKTKAVEQNLPTQNMMIGTPNIETSLANHT